MKSEENKFTIYENRHLLDELYEKYARTIWNILCRRPFTDEMKEKIMVETFQQLWIQSKGIKLTGLLVVSILKERILFFEQR